MANKSIVTGGDKLQQRLAEIAKRLDKAKSVSAGVYARSKYEDGTSVALAGYVHEYGAPAAGIPARPWVRPAVQAHADDWADALAAGLVAENFDATRALTTAGILMQADLKDSIDLVTSPPLKEQTIRRKGFSKPLVDTALLQRSIGFEVQE